MTRYDRLMARISRGERILIDGATGTEIERRGVPQLDNAWNGGGALSEPDVLREVHADYIRAGAEIVISNTFATHRHALQDAGCEEDFEPLNRRGVEIAIEARAVTNAPDVLVAGGIAYWKWMDGWHPIEELRETVEEQAAIMQKAGADLLMLEMMVHVDRMRITLEAAQTSGLPVWVGLSCILDDQGTPMLCHEGSLAEALDVLKGYDVPLINIMHTEVEDVNACLNVVEKHWDRPVGVYAHSARWDGQVTIFDGTVSPEAYAKEASGWLGRDVRVIGGCCGLGVDHITALRPLVA